MVVNELEEILAKAESRGGVKDFPLRGPRNGQERSAEAYSRTFEDSRSRKKKQTKENERGKGIGRDREEERRAQLPVGCKGERGRGRPPASCKRPPASFNLSCMRETKNVEGCLISGLRCGQVLD